MGRMSWWGPGLRFRKSGPPGWRARHAGFITTQTRWHQRPDVGPGEGVPEVALCLSQGEGSNPSAPTMTRAPACLGECYQVRVVAFLTAPKPHGSRGFPFRAWRQYREGLCAVKNIPYGLITMDY